MEIRVCTKCGEEKPATKEFFDKQKGGHFGLRTLCKVCRSRYRKENKEAIAEYSKLLYVEKNREKHQRVCQSIIVKKNQRR